MQVYKHFFSFLFLLMNNNGTCVARLEREREKKETVVCLSLRCIEGFIWSGHIVQPTEMQSTIPLLPALAEETHKNNMKE